MKPSVPLFGPLHHSVQTNISHKQRNPKEQWREIGDEVLAAHLLGVTCPQLESSHSSRRPNGWTRFPRVSTVIDPVTASKRGLPFCLSNYHSSITKICLFPSLLQRRTKQGKEDPWTKQSIASGQICPEEPTEAELQRIPPLLFFLCRHYYI